MGRFSAFTDEELKILFKGLVKNRDNVEGSQTRAMGDEVYSEMTLRVTPTYKDEQLIREHLKKHNVSEYEINAGYEEQGINVFVVATEDKVHDSYYNHHYFVYKGGIYSCTSTEAVQDFLIKKLGKEKECLWN